MLATDLSPSRLARAKLAAQDLIGQLQGDRVGLIAFAGTAFLQAPLTTDYGAVLDALAELDTEHHSARRHEHRRGDHARPTTPSAKARATTAA